MCFDIKRCYNDPSSADFYLAAQGDFKDNKQASPKLKNWTSNDSICVKE
jgi:hypothetical protein